MTADVELLPLPKHSGKATDMFGQKTKLYSGVQMQDYARACVAHATAARDAEIEALRELAEKWRIDSVATIYEPHPYSIGGNQLIECADELEAILARQPAHDEGNEGSQSAEDLAKWLDAKYARHGEDEDRQAAAMLRKLSRAAKRRRLE